MSTKCRISVQCGYTELIACNGNFPAPLRSPPEKTSSGDSILGDYDELDVDHACQSVKADGTGGDRGWHLAAMGAQYWGQENEAGRR